MACPRQALIVEDDDVTRAALAEVFACVCGSVRLAANGREALQVLASGMAPCVMLTDIEMPCMDGRELVATLESRGVRAIPVLTMSGDNGEATDLRKPFALEDLARAVLTCAGPSCGMAVLVPR